MSPDARLSPLTNLNFYYFGHIKVFRMNSKSPRSHLDYSVISIFIKLGVEATFTWVPEDFLEEQEVLRQINGLASTAVRMPGLEGYNQYNVAKALAAGLTIRHVGETARDIVAWYETASGEDRPRGQVLAAEREAEVLAAWHARG